MSIALLVRLLPLTLPTRVTFKIRSVGTCLKPVDISCYRCDVSEPWHDTIQMSTHQGQGWRSGDFQRNELRASPQKSIVKVEICMDIVEIIDINTQGLQIMKIPQNFAKISGRTKPILSTWQLYQLKGNATVDIPLNGDSGSGIKLQHLWVAVVFLGRSQV